MSLQFPLLYSCYYKCVTYREILPTRSNMGVPQIQEKRKEGTRPISSHLDRTSLVNKGFILWPKKKLFLAGPKWDILGDRARWALRGMTIIRWTLHICYTTLYSSKRRIFPNLLGTFLRKLGKSEQETVAKEKSCMIEVYPRSTMIRAKHSFKNG